jgi:hypothetical protein
MIKSRTVRWTGYVAPMWEMRNAYKIMVRKPEGKRPLRRSWNRCENNIKMDLKEIGSEAMKWTHVVQVRDLFLALMSTPSGFIKGGEYLDQLNDYQVVKKDFAP